MRLIAVITPGIALLCLVIFFGLPGLAAWQREIQDFAHGPVFALIAVLAALALRLRWPPGHHPDLQHYALVLLIVLLLGLLTELAQGWYNPAREVSAGDLFRDLLGGLVGLSGLFLIDRRRFRGPRAWPALVGVLAVVILMAPPLHAAAAYARRAANFPKLAEFRYPLDLYFLEASAASMERTLLPEPWAKGRSTPALRLRLEPKKWPGVALLEPEPDWRGYDALCVDLVNPGDRPLELTLRILDRPHDWRFEDRYNGRLLLAPRSRQDFRISLEEIASAPDARRMDLSEIADLRLFLTGGAEGGEFYLTRIMLE